MSEHVEITRHDHGVVLVRMARHDKKNALTGAMYDAMREVIETAGSKDVRAVVFAGGPGAFSAGNDIGDFMMRATSGAETSPAFQFIKALATVEVPMVAAVDGLAIGIGTTMVLHMDLAYASERAIFRMPFIDLALAPEGGSSLLFPRLAGIKKATEWLMLCEAFGAQEAERFGFINAMVPSAEVEARALAAATKLAQKPPAALAAARKLLRGDAAEIRARMNEEAIHFSRQLRSDEAKAAFAAFMTRK